MKSVVTPKVKIYKNGRENTSFSPRNFALKQWSNSEGFYLMLASTASTEIKKK